MYNFDQRNPFPLVCEPDYSYAQAKTHAAQVDEWIGLNISRCESKVCDEFIDVSPCSDVEVWSGLDPQALQTPYIELRWILEELQPLPGQHVVDLGCSYARMGHVVGRHFPDVEFTGFEISRNRFLEAQKGLDQFDYPKVNVVNQDLAEPDFEIPDAEIYFIYDFGSTSVIQHVLEQLRQKAHQKEFRLVARGRRIRHILHQDHPWLAAVNEPQHHTHFSIYFSA